MLLMCIRSYLKPVLKYNFLILETYRPDTIYMRQDVSNRGYFSKPKGVREQKHLGNTVLRSSFDGIIWGNLPHSLRC
jgi:hypothetical protein